MSPRTHSNTGEFEPLLRVSGLGKEYVQRRPFSRKKITVNAFQDVSLTIFPGKTLALVGESGAGKSSLARCIALLERPSTGDIELAGKNLLALSGKELFAMQARGSDDFSGSIVRAESPIDCLRDHCGATADSA